MVVVHQTIEVALEVQAPTMVVDLAPTMEMNLALTMEVDQALTMEVDLAPTMVAQALTKWALTMEVHTQTKGVQAPTMVVQVPTMEVDQAPTMVVDHKTIDI